MPTPSSLSLGKLCQHLSCTIDDLGSDVWSKSNVCSGDLSISGDMLLAHAVFIFSSEFAAMENTESDGYHPFTHRSKNKKPKSSMLSTRDVGQVYIHVRVNVICKSPDLVENLYQSFLTYDEANESWLHHCINASHQDIASNVDTDDGQGTKTTKEGYTGDDGSCSTPVLKEMTIPMAFCVGVMLGMSICKRNMS
ncbi:hypothetical protein RJT34_02567 [Clitoria ternatea]|uniref:Uncharacterized protein n=1 Tax=Clitoria ternatea TaxID=43366 RepID=A0AAN9Q0F4_CLITE